MDLDRVIFANLTIEHLLWIAGGIVLLLVLVSIFKRLFAKKEEAPHYQKTRCQNCGWQGQISRLAGRCPQCNEPLGEQRIKQWQK